MTASAVVATRRRTLVVAGHADSAPSVLYPRPGDDSPARRSRHSVETDEHVPITVSEAFVAKLYARAFLLPGIEPNPVKAPGNVLGKESR